MHLQTVYKLLLATTEQPYGFLKIADPMFENDLREMVELGLVDATLRDGRTTNFSAINRVTREGERFLRVFEGANCAVLRVYRKRKQEAARVLEQAKLLKSEPSRASEAGSPVSVAANDIPERGVNGRGMQIHATAAGSPA